MANNFYLSTGLATALAGSADMKTVMDLGFIDFYSGPVPADADADIGAATLLTRVSISSGATGLTLQQDGRQLRKPPGDTWTGLNAATGTATFYRHVTASDTGVASTVEERMQGLVGSTNAAEMTLSNVSFVSGQTFALNGYVIEQPTHG